jgi:hypothetical protein
MTRKRAQKHAQIIHHVPVNVAWGVAEKHLLAAWIATVRLP